MRHIKFRAPAGCNSDTYEYQWKFCRMLDMRNNGFIINAMHTREGCYTYIKEIIDGNSVIVLSEEEQEALKRAMDPNSNLKNSDEE